MRLFKSASPALLVTLANASPLAKSHEVPDTAASIPENKLATAAETIFPSKFMEVLNKYLHGDAEAANEDDAAINLPQTDPTTITLKISEPVLDGRDTDPRPWENSNGQRKPPCPGWPARVQYNETHWAEWTFLHGYIYGELDPNCIISNGHP